MNLSPIVLIWTAIALTGLAMDLFGLRDALGDLYWIPPGVHIRIRLLIAQGNARTALGRCIVFGMFSILGLYELFGGLVWPTPLMSIIVTTGFFISSITLVSVSILDRLDRRTLLRMSRDSLPENNGG